MVSLHRALGGPKDPVCTVCIANYNGRALLADCVDSLLSQTVAGRIEILVHDDASTDDSVAFIRERYPQVAILVSESNVGFCIGNNRMAEMASAPFLLLLNNDAALLPDAIEALLEAAVIHGKGDVLTLPQYDWQDGALIDRGCALDLFYNPVPNRREGMRDVAMTIGACLWIARDTWHALGGFPEWMESIGEDLYLCCLARLQGGRVIALAHSGYRHWQGKTFGGNRVTGDGLVTTLKRRRLSERNKSFAMVACTPGPVVWPLLALHIVLLMAEGTLMALLRRDRRIFFDIYLNVPCQLRAHWRSLISHRERNMRRRRVGLGAYLSTFSPLPRKLSMLLRYGVPRVRH
ncbi:glycosyltransferase [Luteibacter sp. ME-Dv--P-043b]|uniref:glycosyltransferase family 2 protein n=1 Tax=Luteibacter sp. ME-Dv--P-043b TaxID=3040291 RepID=UPI0025563B22|nr:glycosyltransferase [Luteibacter sp. ME-Dv--P-043b]